MKKSLLIGASLLAAALPLATFAQVGVNANVQATVNANTTTNANVTTGVKAEVTTAPVRAAITGSTNVAADTKAKDRAAQEIDRRIENLNKAAARVGNMNKLSEQDKAGIQATIGGQVSALAALKAKIDADTALADLKTDVKSITTDYRIYVLLLPQVRIIASADRVVTVAGKMNDLEMKLATRITAFTGDKSALIQADTELKGKIVDANTQAQAAANAVVVLKPDNGDAAVAKANAAALKDAEAKIKVATKDLADARADIGKILSILKGGMSANAQGSASTTVNSQ